MEMFKGVSYTSIMAMPSSRRYRLVSWKIELEKKKAARLK
jgi:hypothetical protein